MSVRNARTLLLCLDPCNLSQTLDGALEKYSTDNWVTRLCHCTELDDLFWDTVCIHTTSPATSNSSLYFVSSRERPWCHSARRRINATKRILRASIPGGALLWLNVWENTQVTREITNVLFCTTRWRHGRPRGETKYRMTMKIVARCLKVLSSPPIHQSDRHNSCLTVYSNSHNDTDRQFKNRFLYIGIPPPSLQRTFLLNKLVVCVVVWVHLSDQIAI